MDNTRLSAVLSELFETVPGNFVDPALALRPDLAGMQMYDTPFFGVAAADDPIFTEYKKLGVIGPWHKSPAEWLPGAKTVVSVVFPFTEQVKASNRKETMRGSDEWSHNRSDGQKFQNAFMAALEARLRAEGIGAYVPNLDGGWRSYNRGKDLEEYPGTNENTYSSNWSERHAAYAAGLGSFSLTRGFITERGLAVRFSSVITDNPFTVTPRTCTNVYDHCTMCGACIKRCPAHAITFEEGKLHYPCNMYTLENCVRANGYYGCGLCMTNVPCESGIPKRV